MVGASDKSAGNAGPQRPASPGPAPPPAGFLIRKLREQARLTQAEMARRLGVDRKTYNGLECGRTPLDSPLACDIAAILKVDPFEMMLAQVRLDWWRKQTGQGRRTPRKGHEHGEFPAPAG